MSKRMVGGPSLRRVLLLIDRAQLNGMKVCKKRQRDDTEPLPSIYVNQAAAHFDLLFAFVFASFTPGQPAFSAMNSPPAFSRAARIGRRGARLRGQMPFDQHYGGRESGCDFRDANFANSILHAFY
jgi:hypothetical protein